MLINKLGVITVLVIVFFSISRIILPFEFSFSKVIVSYKIYPIIITFFTQTIFRVGNHNISLFNLIMILWISVGSVLLLNFTIKYFNFFYKIKKVSFIKDMQSEEIMSQICTSTSMLEKIIIVKSSAIRTPCVVGVISPTIFLPNIELRDSELYLILLHEWTHFKNKDSLIKIFAQILCCMFWWNPLLHLFVKELDQLLEIRCDQKVTENFSKEEIKEYLNTLLLVIKKNSKTPLTKKASMIGQSYFVTEQNNNMKQRFELIVKKNTSRKGFIFLVFFMVLNVFSFFVIIQPGFEAPDTIENGAVFNIDDAYIVSVSGSGYQLFSNGQYIGPISKEVATDLKNQGFQIYQ